MGGSSSFIGLPTLELFCQKRVLCWSIQVSFWLNTLLDVEYEKYGWPLGDPAAAGPCNAVGVLPIERDHQEERICYFCETLLLCGLRSAERDSLVVRLDARHPKIHGPVQDGVRRLRAHGVGLAQERTEQRPRLWSL
eukprot:GHVL01010655.1.p2 GENE.GHVL01010655.1~~GHVL01010655.1.p2  ORF type:complete len:137 (+),score=7.01 GHVL01010655.1:24-434(+)